MGLSDKQKVVVSTSGSSAPWLLLAQIILLALYYGAGWHSMPWWLVFAPILIFVIEVMILIGCLVGFGVGVLAAALTDSGAAGLIFGAAAAIAMFIFVCIPYIWTWATGILMHFL